MEYNESPLLLLVNCEPTAETRDLPVYVYETVLQIIDEMPVTSFAKIPYRIESEEVWAHDTSTEQHVHMI